MKYIFGNWKMYLDYKQSVDLANSLVKENLKNENVEIAVFPTALTMKDVTDILQNTNFKTGAQDAGHPSHGAYTGMISAEMYKNIGCTYALAGHSERRHIFGETNKDVRAKIESYLDAGLKTVVCIGETEQDRNNDKARYRLAKQILRAFEGLNFAQGQILVAYEPVWAIGTGNACLPADAIDRIDFIKLEIAKYSQNMVPVLYGGSVDENNVLSYFSEDIIDGVLVGGASAKLDNFTDIIKNVLK
ncbi:MAG: hypothetical protein ACD_18C00106G0002 [uncultured bacterium]|nr:MAG: hypothetical protein ACD_18C00106G0002 [uncultured bacterium]OGH91464.1 MAG: triose-phosphate isomerase [Candidatus Magasanikbacteria bacterium RIFOXYD12_FULL_33_17]